MRAAFFMPRRAKMPMRVNARRHEHAARRAFSAFAAMRHEARQQSGRAYASVSSRGSRAYRR